MYRYKPLSYWLPYQHPEQMPDLIGKVHHNNHDKQCIVYPAAVGFVAGIAGRGLFRMRHIDPESNPGSIVDPPHMILSWLFEN